MDPDKILTDLRRSSKTLLRQYDGGQRINEDVAENLTEKFQLLDEWLTKGLVALPQQWQPKPQRRK